jgi:hypothetical protein
MAGMGQNPNLPRRNSNGRFTSINGHYVGKPALLRFSHGSPEQLDAD